MIFFIADARAQLEHSGVAGCACDIHHIVFKNAGVETLEGINGVIVRFIVVGIDNGVAADHRVIVKSKIDGFELLVSEIAVFHQNASVECGHVVPLQIECDTAVDELAAHKRVVVPVAAAVHVDEVFVVVA